jgi:putative endonuclease
MSLWTRLRTRLAACRPWRPARHVTLGERGERQAERFLAKRGLRVVERNYRNHVGEIDLIAVDQTSRPRTIVFVEVKTRQSDHKGQPVEAVDDRKQRQLTSTAMVFLRQHDLLECRYRFDIVGILWPDRAPQPQIRHFVDAFPPTGKGQMFQ